MRTPLILAVVITVVGTILYNSNKSKISYALKRLTTSHHTVSYDGVGFYPEFIVIQLGDSVQIKNSSKKAMEIAVGKHDDHKTLQGFQEKVIEKGAEYTFTPKETGVFDLHDHFNPKKLGALIVDE